MFCFLGVNNPWWTKLVPSRYGFLEGFYFKN